ncbi:MAG: hypothetical protein IT336_04155 [Thermomicrobiales bacterium]|nr:hypothetical protein [Thermomicrobiales bacterium]
MDDGTGRAFAQYIRAIADWRRRRYDDDLRDRRNLRSADAMIELAVYVESLPSDDPRLMRLGQLCLRGEVFELSPQAAYELGRFRFFSEEATIDGFLDQLVGMAEADAREGGNFGGPQVPGDEPWH